jgi:hypothetical protein
MRRAFGKYRRLVGFIARLRVHFPGRKAPGVHEVAHAQGAALGSEDLIARLRYYLGAAAWPDTAPQEVADAPRGKVIEVSGREAFIASARALVNTPGSESILDVGCGVRPFALRRWQTHICLEPFEPYVDELVHRSRFVPGLVAIRGEAPGDLGRFPSASVDVVMLADVIEHMERNAGLETLREAKRIARHRVHVFTPDGFMPQHLGADDDDEWGYVGNELQEHHSGWTIEDFPDWTVVRCPGYYRECGALWATWRRDSPHTHAHAVLYLLDPFDDSPEWQLWIGTLGSTFTFFGAYVHPELAPWSFRARRRPWLPHSVFGLDIVPPSTNGPGLRCPSCGVSEPDARIIVAIEPTSVPEPLLGGKTVILLTDPAMRHPYHVDPSGAQWVALADTDQISEVIRHIA